MENEIIIDHMEIEIPLEPKLFSFLKRILGIRPLTKIYVYELVAEQKDLHKPYLKFFNPHTNMSFYESVPPGLTTISDVIEWRNIYLRQWQKL